MVQDADKIGAQVTVGDDDRITRVGKIIRKLRLDEICQLIDVFRGTMTFVGTRPEVPKFVASYTSEMMATLLLPAGVTSITSIYYKDEDELLKNSTNIDETYINDILPDKMKVKLIIIDSFEKGEAQPFKYFYEGERIEKFTYSPKDAPKLIETIF